MSIRGTSRLLEWWTACHLPRSTPYSLAESSPFSPEWQSRAVAEAASVRLAEHTTLSDLSQIRHTHKDVSELPICLDITGRVKPAFGHRTVPSASCSVEP